jgi:hypothetical protein
MSKRSKNVTSEIKRRKNLYARVMRKAASGDPRLPPPIIVGPLLGDASQLSFGAFISLPETRALFGLNTDGAKLLSKLVKEREFQRLRARSDLKNKARWRKRLGEYVRHAYLGDRRGLLYWRRVGKVIWVAYENLLRLKVWAARTRDHEIARIERWEARADKERERVRAHRARKKAESKKRGPKRQRN